MGTLGLHSSLVDAYKIFFLLQDAEKDLNEAEDYQQALVAIADASAVLKESKND